MLSACGLVATREMPPHSPEALALEVQLEGGALGSDTWRGNLTLFNGKVTTMLLASWHLCCAAGIWVACASRCK